MKMLIIALILTASLNLFLPIVPCRQENEKMKTVDFFLNSERQDMYRGFRDDQIDFEQLKTQTIAAFDDDSIDNRIIWSMIGKKYFHYGPEVLQKNQDWITTPAGVVVYSENEEAELRINSKFVSKDINENYKLGDTPFQLVIPQPLKNVSKPVAVTIFYQNNCLVITDLTSQSCFWIYSKQIKNKTNVSGAKNGTDTAKPESKSPE